METLSLVHPDIFVLQGKEEPTPALQSPGHLFNNTKPSSTALRETYQDLRRICKQAGNMPVLSLRQAGDFQPPEPPSQEYLDESNVASILGLTGAFTFLAVGVVCLRLFVRSYMLRFVGADDWTMLAAVLMALGTFICLCGESQYGMGRHWEWPEPWMFMPYLKWLFAHNLLVMWGVLLVKISIAIFLMRIMLQKFWKIFLWSSVGKYNAI